MTYYRPSNLSEALDALDRHGAIVAAGCTDLFAATRAQTLAGSVVDITGIAELKGIDHTDAGWRIGGATTWSEIIAADLPPAFDGLKLAAREVGSVQIQNVGTVAGNLINASPAADGPPPLLGLDAQVELVSATRGVRRLALEELIRGPRDTQREADEIVLAIHIPAAAGEGFGHFLKLGARKYLVISIAMVAVRVFMGNGRVLGAAISVGACSPVAVRLRGLEELLVGMAVDEFAVKVRAVIESFDLAQMLHPIDDIRADGEYRLIAAARLVERALIAAVWRASEAVN